MSSYQIFDASRAYAMEEIGSGGVAGGPRGCSQYLW